MEAKGIWVILYGSNKSTGIQVVTIIVTMLFACRLATGLRFRHTVLVWYLPAITTFWSQLVSVVPKPSFSDTSSLIYDLGLSIHMPVWIYENH